MSLRLHSLEIINFKSYYGEHLIGPFFGFNCVIGSNGSGKSNLMDAVSFVLGVQGDSMRSAKLKELINSNAGDDAECSVTAVFTGVELRLKRTVNASGSSSYYIDDKRVTWTNYNKLLQKHNIIVKARNFLVFQGDVEAVASQSAKQLSKLFDLISDSSSLQQEYDDAKERLERLTETSTLNFSKKRGFTTELKLYKDQKDEAMRFVEKENARKELNLTLNLWRLWRLESNVEKTREELEDLNESNSNGIEAADEKLKQLKKDHVKISRELTRAEKKVKDKEKEIDDMTPLILKTAQTKSRSLKKLETAKSNLEKAKVDLKAMSTNLQDLKTQKAGVERAKEIFEETSRRDGERRGIVLDESDLREYRSLKEQVARNTASQSQKLPTMNRKVKAAKERMTRLKEKSQELERKRLEVRGKLDGAGTEQGLNEKLESLRIQRDDVQAAYNEARREFEKSASEKRRLLQLEKENREKLEHLEANLETARADKYESEKELKMKEFVDSLKKLFPGVRGRLMNLCKPTQRKFDVAVSIILGRNIDSIVVDTQQVAVECIQVSFLLTFVGQSILNSNPSLQYLRNQRIGQATFLPLDTIQSKPIAEKYRNFVKGARLAVDIIQYEPIYEKAILLACGNALVCDNLDIARDICYEKGIEIKAVTLDGTLIHKAGLITGGQSKDTNARRWDDKDVEEMKNAREALRNEVQDIQNQIRKSDGDDSRRASVESNQSKLKEINDSFDENTRKIDELKKELAHVEKELRTTDKDITTVNAEIEEQTEKIDQLDSEIRREENRIFSAFCRKIGVATIRDYEGNDKVNEVLERMAEFNDQISKLEQVIEFETGRITEINSRIQSLTTTIAKDQQSADTATEEYEQLNQTRDEMKEDLAEMKQEATKVLEQQEHVAREVADAKKEVTRLTRLEEERLRDISKKEASIERLELERIEILRRCKLEEIEIPVRVGKSKKKVLLNEIENLELVGNEEGPSASQTEQVSFSSLKVDYDDLNDEEKENLSDEMEFEFIESIKNLTADIERMAPNMRATERLDDVESKLKETANEFEKARKEAKDAKEKFNALKVERTNRFVEAFNHVSSRIDGIYKELTRSRTFPLGGTAYLSLEAGDEPYLQGVKYHAMPPMKRFRDMEQLSGGEKTVAALALLFAIHSFKPAPFFVLDEVDAALDNTNVAKVANYIRRHANESAQFLVISLKATFYEKASALVGVYRDNEEQTSKVLTLELDGRFED
ncbi:Structural maintenance of chromosomes protein 1 [Nowakowskiella sp. JEL0407]|nr:Structural maintenance of chromosomes protein 1 [Nowakowskiella sp. JEL0407]KAJ3126699.1 Structural maintenance of chromosomes protein 1 [Nowakowskiella sp. JEL0407]